MAISPTDPAIANRRAYEDQQMTARVIALQAFVMSQEQAYAAFVASQKDSIASDDATITAQYATQETSILSDLSTFKASLAAFDGTLSEAASLATSWAAICVRVTNELGGFQNDGGPASPWHLIDALADDERAGACACFFAGAGAGSAAMAWSLAVQNGSQSYETLRLLIALGEAVQVTIAALPEASSEDIARLDAARLHVKQGDVKSAADAANGSPYFNAGGGPPKTTTATDDKYLVRVARNALGIARVG